MLLKCYTQYISKYGKLSSGHRTRKVQFSSQRRAMPKNVQINIHLLARFISHASKVMLKILQASLQQLHVLRTSRCTSWVSKRQRNQRSNYQHSLRHGESKRVPEKTSTSAPSATLKPLTVWTTTNWKILFFPFIFISWRLITLQYCSGFAIHWHESAMYLHVFPTLNTPPTSLPVPSLWVIPVHQPQALVSCIQPGLVICFTFDNIHVLMLFSQIIPPSPFPIESKSLFYTSVSLFLSCI